MNGIEEARIPVLVGWGESIERSNPVSALDMAESASQQALSVHPELRSKIEQVSVVNILSRTGNAPASALAARLGLAPKRCETTTIGGNTPQWLVTRAANAIAAGELSAALIAGGEAMRSQKAGAPPASDDSSLEGDPVIGDARSGLTDAELAIGLMLPVHIYPMFESAIAHRERRSYEQQRRHIGQIMAQFTEVAAKRPYAWFPETRSWEEIASPSGDNRIVAEPYTKLMSAFLGVDQGAAVVVCSLAVAKELGLGDQVVFIWSGADCNDVWAPSARTEPGSSPGIKAAGDAALEGAGIGVDEISAFDFYSCFPCAVEMAMEAFALTKDDPRGFTVTGGLPYHGGPGNNYTTHAIAAMAERLRDSKESKAIGLVTGLGWYATKHSVGIYANAPSPSGFRKMDTSQAQASIDASSAPVRQEAAGEATVVASTVIYHHDGTVSGAPVVARMDDGSQIAAQAHDSILSELAGVNLVGERIVLEGKPPRYHRLAG
jgi:acetyl-CoA C-acetyltransferase